MFNFIRNLFVRESAPIVVPCLFEVSDYLLPAKHRFAQKEALLKHFGAPALLDTMADLLLRDSYSEPNAKKAEVLRATAEAALDFAELLPELYNFLLAEEDTSDEDESILSDDDDLEEKLRQSLKERGVSAE